MLNLHYNKDIKSRKIIGQYQNGNYMVYIMDDGTKIRYTDDDFFNPDFPESIDFEITKRCSLGCPNCYADCLPSGKLWDKSLNDSILESLHPYTEIAINGNDWRDIPDLMAFLTQMKKQHVFVNATFHFEQYRKLWPELKELQEDNLLNGIGVSIPSHVNAADLICLNYCKNVVLHVIAGIFNKQLYEQLADKDYRLLILGYKQIGRGKLYQRLYNDEILDNMQWLHDNLSEVMTGFKVCSFDNLALEQLEVKDKIDPKVWEQNYMGDDGQFTMFIDAVNCKYAKNSVQDKQHRYSYNIKELENATIIDLFNKIRIVSNPDIDKLDLD